MNKSCTKFFQSSQLISHVAAKNWFSLHWNILVFHGTLFTNTSIIMIGSELVRPSSGACSPLPSTQKVRLRLKYIILVSYTNVRHENWGFSAPHVSPPWKIWRITWYRISEEICLLILELNDTTDLFLTFGTVSYHIVKKKRK